MRWSWVLLFFFAGCAGARLADSGQTDFAVTVERSLAEAERELLASGNCTQRVAATCEKGRAVWLTTGFAGWTEWFDPNGKRLGRSASNCLGHDASGTVGQCTPAREESLCARAMTHLARTGATVKVGSGSDLEVREVRAGEELQLGPLRGVVLFEPGAPVRLRVSTIERDVKLLAGPYLGEPTLDVHRDDVIDLPMRVVDDEGFFEGTVDVVRQRYVRLQGS